ncbi:winged helix-turn-helix transcriptional regulator [Candidatus Poribacteria bacterium]
MEVIKGSTKFRVKADLALFQAIQQDGRLSEQSIASRTNIPSTTVHYAMKRIRRRDFFEIKAVPRFEQFQEIPMAVMGFADVHPLKVQELRNQYASRPEVVQFLHSDKDVVLYIMDARASTLTEKLVSIMELVAEKPCLYITSPKIVKYNAAIPDHVLDGVYDHLPDRKIHV